jgi:hypothetical protein
VNLLELQSDPNAFREALLIDTEAGPAPLVEKIDDWQLHDFRALDSGWQRAVVGTSLNADHQRAWLERPRGHSKSLDLGIMAAWALFASRRRLSLIGCAADQDQARLLRDAIGKLVWVNPWLARMIEVQNYRVVNPNTGSSLDIISSDVKSSYGLTPDGIICDEVVHWKSRDLWDSLLSSAAKRSTCMLVVLTNAGLSDDWQWQTREAIRQDPNWYFSRLEGPCASWITADRLQEQERLLPSVAYRRLWQNEWTSGGGDALTEELIRAAFDAHLSPVSRAMPDWEYVGGLDLGVARDASAVCILGVKRGREGHGHIRLAHTRLWRPSRGTRVDLQEVEDSLRDLHGRFDLKALNYDPWEARHLASRLQAGGLSVYRSKLSKLTASGHKGEHYASTKVPMVEITSTPKNLQQMATVVIEAFNDRRLELYEEADLKKDLSRLRVEERQFGFRLTSPRDELGHGDMGTAFTLALLAASELAAKKKIVAGASWFSVSAQGIQAMGSVSSPDAGEAEGPLDRAEARRQWLEDSINEERQRIASLPPDYNSDFYRFMKHNGRLGS